MQRNRWILLWTILLCSGIIKAQDLKLWYRQPAMKWTEALPIGNGRLGAMVFGGVENEQLQFNEETLWSGEPRTYSRPGAYRYLDSIRQLLFAGKQKEAEALAEKEFMGTKSFEAERSAWVNASTADKKYAAPDFDDSQWKTMYVPSWDGWETVGFGGLDGAVWLRTSFILPDNWQESDMIADFNRIRDHDYTYVNGVLVGSQQNTEGRKYKVARNLLHKGKNSIAILVLNFFDKGGIYGYKDTSIHIGIYPEGKEKEKIELAGQWKYYVVNDNPPPVGVYQASYQPFGDLYLLFPHTGAVSNYRRELDISTAVASTTYTYDSISYKREYFVSAPDQAIVTQLTASKKATISCKVMMSSPHRNYTIDKFDNNTLVLSVKVRTGAMQGKSYIRVITKGGKISFDSTQLVIDKADEATIYVTAGSNF